MRRLLATTAAIAATLLLTPVASADPASHSTAATTLGTFDDFARIFQRSAGQFTDSSGGYTGQWAYAPQSGGSAPGAVSHIQWGSPTSWPPSSYERFERSDDGAWVLLDGFGDTGGFLKQRVTREVLSDIDCTTNPTTLPLAEPELIDGVPMGKQHYTKWNVQPSAYCLQTWGVIEIPGGTNVNFYHRQGYWPPSSPTCSNRFTANQVCVKAYETWEDDNPANVASSYGPGTQPGLNLIHSRDNILAKGRGHMFIHTNYLANWSAAGKAYWTW